MNDKQDVRVEDAEDIEPRELTTEEILAIAGGPQVINDWPG